MSKTIFIILLSSAFCLTNNSFGQYENHNLDGNNANATISNSGLFFHNTDAGTGGYEVPNDEGTHAFYSMGFWFSGNDVDGELKLSAQTYTPEGDLFTGPITTTGVAEVAPSSDSYGVYPVSKDEIEAHIENYDEMGYVIPSSILNWPAHGDLDEGLDYYLAPFVDIDGNGVYEPENGDYPKIKGDEACYVILNDKGGIHESGGDPIGLELHYLIYQYSSGDFLDDVTFINLKVINRGTQTIFDFKVGCFADVDLGNPNDDYVGYNGDHQMMYVYNGDNVDEDFGATLGFGENPPAVGISQLNLGASSFATFSTDGGPKGLPTAPAHYFNYMNGKWKDGAPFVEGFDGYVGDGPETNFLYSGDPNNPEEWSQVNGWIDAGDHRMVMSSESIVLRPQDELCFDYAVMYAKAGDHLANVDLLNVLAMDVASFYELDETPYCSAAISSLSENKEIALDIYPNPNQGEFTIEAEGEYSVLILAMDGREVYRVSQLTGKNLISTDFANGTYLVVLEDANQNSTNQLIIINK